MRTLTSIVAAAGLFALAPLAASIPIPVPISSGLVSQGDLLLQSRSLPHLVSWLCDLPRMDKVCQKWVGFGVPPVNHVPTLMMRCTRRTQAFVATKWAAALPPKDAANTVALPLGRALGAQLRQVARYTIPYAKAPVGGLRFKVRSSRFSSARLTADSHHSEAS